LRQKNTRSPLFSIHNAGHFLRVFTPKKPVISVKQGLEPLKVAFSAAFEKNIFQNA